jgi:hypothetical protein
MFWRDLDNIENAIETFAILMRDEMFDRAAEGYEGWGDESNEEEIKKYLADHVERQKWIGVANFAMMLHHFEQKQKGGS